jgi:hypothetical protein
MSARTPEQIRALALVCSAILDAVREAGSTGAPGGVIYAGLMAAGCSLAQYEAMMGTLVRIGRLERRGEIYFARSAP